MIAPVLTLVLWAVASGLGQETRAGYTATADPDVPEAYVSQVEDAVEDGLRELAPFFPGTPNRPFSVVVHDSAGSLPEEVAAWLHRGAPGLALLGTQEIHLIRREMVADGPTNLRDVVEHELVHILLHQLCGSGPDRLPLWFHEGLAQELSGAMYLGAREEDLVFGARFDNLPSLTSLETSFPSDDFRRRQAYAQSFSFVAYLRRQLGLEELLEIARASGRGSDFGQAFVERTRRSLVSFESEWLDYLEDESGAAFRVVMRNCFSYLMILAVPVLALAVIRRLARDKKAGEKLAAAEEEEEQAW